MIELENLEEFCLGIDAFVAETREVWGSHFSDWANLLYMQIVSESPQWSGNFAANWNFAIMRESKDYAEYNVTADWQSLAPGARMGDEEAIDEALTRTAVERNRVDLNTTVFINNLTPYADAWVNEPAGKLRAGNYIDPAPIPIGNVMLLADKLFELAQSGAR